MKTRRTKRGVVYEIYETVSGEHYIGVLEQETRVKSLEDGDKWVDAIVIGDLSRKLQELCIAKTNDSEYWSISVYTLDKVSAVVNRLEVSGGFLTGKQLGSEFLNGVEEIEMFLEGQRL